MIWIYLNIGYQKNMNHGFSKIMFPIRHDFWVPHFQIKILRLISWRLLQPSPRVDLDLKKAMATGIHYWAFFFFMGKSWQNSPQRKPGSLAGCHRRCHRLSRNSQIRFAISLSFSKDFPNWHCHLWGSSVDTSCLHDNMNAIYEATSWPRLIG